MSSLRRINAMSSAEQRRLLKAWGFTPAGYSNGHPRMSYKGQTVTLSGEGQRASWPGMHQAADIRGIPIREFLDGPPKATTMIIASTARAHPPTLSSSEPDDRLRVEDVVRINASAAGAPKLTKFRRAVLRALETRTDQTPQELRALIDLSKSPTTFSSGMSRMVDAGLLRRHWSNHPTGGRQGRYCLTTIAAYKEHLEQSGALAPATLPAPDEAPPPPPTPATAPQAPPAPPPRRPQAPPATDGKLFQEIRHFPDDSLLLQDEEGGVWIATMERLII